MLADCVAAGMGVTALPSSAARVATLFVWRRNIPINQARLAFLATLQEVLGGAHG